MTRRYRLSAAEAGSRICFFEHLFWFAAINTGFLIAMGATDIALSPFWVFPTMSPEARANWFGVEYEDL